MEKKFDDYYVDLARGVLTDAGVKLQKAQSYIYQAGFQESMTIPKFMVRLVNLNNRIISHLLWYLQPLEK